MHLLTVHHMVQTMTLKFEILTTGHTQGLKLNCWTLVIHYSMGVSFNYYSLLVLVVIRVYVLVD